MATIQTTSEIKPLQIDYFYGLNQAKMGDTQINMGESGDMKNCYVTKDYDISKMYGYLQLMTSTTKKIQGMWYGYVGTTQYFVFATNGHLYYLDNGWQDNFVSTTDWTTVANDIGTLTDAPTTMFGFNKKLYVLNGAEYKSWDGSTFADVAGYVPKTYISCLPATGAGTAYENLNLLTGKRHKTYNGDNNATVYYLTDTNVDSIDAVYVNGILQTLTTHYTISLANGTVTFGTKPATGLDNVDIYYTKGTGTRTTVTNNTQAFLFGTAADTRVFLYGNPNFINRRINSQIEVVGSLPHPSVEYFTETNIDDIGDSATAITSMERVNGIMLVHKTNETYYSYYDSVNLDGVDNVTFPTPIINGSRGNIPMGQGVLLNNDPFTIDNQLLKWTPTTIKDERNVQPMSGRIQKGLDYLDIKDTLMIDKENTSELFISNGYKLWIYKYNLVNHLTKEKGVFSYCELEDTPTCWLQVNGKLYFGTDTGLIMKLDESYLTYNGVAIDSYWEMNMYDFGAEWLKKTLNKSWITLGASSNVSANIEYVTENNAYSTPYAVSYHLSTFSNVDFNNFTFYTNYNPQVFYLRLKAKKFKFIKLRISNNSLTDTWSMLNLTLKAEYGSEAK